MSEYIRRSDGPGSIGALLPGAALSHPPTIGSNDPGRSIGNRSHGAYGIRSLNSLGNDGIFANGEGVFSGCSSCGMGNENGEGLPSWTTPVALLAVFGGALWWIKRSRDRDEEASELARYYY